jgi:hypothetical protein
MVSRGFGLYDPDGRIVFAHAWTKTIDVSRAVGDLVWDHFAEEGRPAVRAAFLKALTVCQQADVRTPLEPSIWGQQVCSVRFLPTALPVTPVAGMFAVMSSGVESLGEEAWLVAKLLPSHTSKEIASILGVSRRTVESIKRRLADALEVPRYDLPRTIAIIRDLLLD